jgi:2-polyprenyl-6-methoxyphenol hydroxylase-like FAD-dependent oxidoreductase
LGGLFAAHLLRAIGWDVAVFEQESGDLAGRGAGIGTHEALFQVMKHIGLRIDDSMGVLTRSYTALNREGSIVCDVAVRRTMSAWPRFYRPLKDHLPAVCYHFGKRLKHVEPDRKGVTAMFTDGSHMSADLLIGADGNRSTVRNQFLPEIKPAYAGYIAWRAIVPEERLCHETRELLIERFVFCLIDGQLVLAYPVPLYAGDRRAYNVVWYCPTDPDTLNHLCTDAQGRRHPGSIPPPLIRPEVVARAKQAARTRLAPQIAEIVTHADQLFFQPIDDLASSSLVFANVVLLGDAAFVARPHVGAGVTKAALDAVCLAEAIAVDRDLTAALARYDQERQTFGLWAVNRGRQLAACAGLGGAPQEAPERTSREPSDRFMREHIATISDIHRLTANAAVFSA